MGKNAKKTRCILACWCTLFLAFYIIIGLQPVPAEAASYIADSTLSIPSLNLSSDVMNLSLENNKLNTPDTIIGAYSSTNTTTLLIGHSTTAFKNLNNIKHSAIITYNNEKYIVSSIETLKKSDIKMSSLLAKRPKKTIILMTCAGELLDNGDATERLIITATIK